MNKYSFNLNNLVYLSLHYTLCPVEIREAWSHALLQRKFSKDLFYEWVPIGTCNRFDLVLYEENADKVLLSKFWDLGRDFLSVQQLHDGSKSKVTEDDLERYVTVYRGNEALKKLFAVSGSLDSLVLGEPHILGQVKHAYALSHEYGSSSSLLHKIFSKSFNVAKRIRSETDIGKNGVSIGHAAVQMTQRIFSDLSECSILVLGAGEMGRICARHFFSLGVGELTVANRTYKKAEILAQELSIRSLSLDQALSQICDFDVVITATSKAEYLIGPSCFSKDFKKRLGKNMVIVDVCVPRNVDPAINKIDSLFLFDIDDLDVVMQEHRKAREGAKSLAYKIIEEEAANFELNQAVHNHSIAKLNDLITNLAEEEIKKTLSKFKVIQDDQVKVTASALAKKVVAKIVRPHHKKEVDLDRINQALAEAFHWEEL